METSYSGLAEAEEFTLEFERFIIRDHEIAVQGYGEDFDGDFELEGSGARNDIGYYHITINLVYPGWSSLEAHQGNKPYEETGTIIITSLKESPKKKRCSIQGIWKQNGDEYHFKANLASIIK